MSSAWRADAPGLRDWLRARVAELIEVRPLEVDTTTAVQEHGLSSRDSVMLAGELEDLLDTEIPATLLWEHPTIDDIAEFLAAPGGAESGTGAEPAAQQTASAATEPVAVVGLGCRLPGADGPEQFWDLLSSGRDAVGRVPDGRWEQFAGRGDADDEVLARTPRSGGFLSDVSGFDAEFFGITPREAALMDPQQRVLLEVTWEALEHAGIRPQRLRGSATGVFVGVSTQDYAQLTLSEPSAVDAWTSTGVAPSIASNRLSYILDLRGPSVTLDTACSSSLVAVHQACQSLRAGEVDAALVGGVNMMLSPGPTINFDLGGALAADGRCKAFDADADGITRGEGCAVVVLKRLTDAHRDGDRVLALLRGSAVNSDGSSNGLTAPSPAAQRDLLRAAYDRAEADPGGVDYVEAHGTGTLLGDPIEASALGEVLGGGRQDQHPLLLGSVKTNLGHLEAAAGLAGLVKVVLAMTHGQIPPSLHFHTPNPYIEFEAQRLRVVTAGTPWPRGAGVARAGVSGFGFGGTNAHVVLEEYTATRDDDVSTPAVTGSGPEVVALSARSPERLGVAARELADWLETPRGSVVDTHALAATLARRRTAWHTRAAVLADDNTALVSALRSLAEGESVPDVLTGRAGADGPGPVWVFSGYGSQWSGMGTGLLAAEPVFARRIDELDPHFTEYAGFSLRKVIEAGESIEDLERAQLVIFGIQLGLATLWRSLGVEPAAVIGHSMGEVAAAVVAGGVGTEDGVRVMATRSRLLASQNDLGGGAMAAVELSTDELGPLQEHYPQVAVAVYGAPGQLTVAGDEQQVRELVRHVEGMGRTARLLPVRGAGHSAAVDPVLGELRAQLRDVVGARPAVPYYTSVFHDPREEPVFDAEYWAANARRPVRFEQAVAAALADGHDTFLEVSPHPLTSGALAHTAGNHDKQTPTVVASVRRGHDEVRTVRAGLGKLYCAGVAPAWEKTYPGNELVDVPHTPWRHHQHWAPTRRAPARVAAAASTVSDSSLGVAERLGDGTWRWRSERRGAEVTIEGCLALVGAAGAAWSDSPRVRDFRWSAPADLADTVVLTTSLTATQPREATVEIRAARADATDGETGVIVATATVHPADEASGGDHNRAVRFADELRSAGREEAPGMLAEHVRAVIAEIMGFRPEQLSATEPLVELGLDSLMTMRIKNVLEHELDIGEVAPAELRAASLDDVTDHLAGLLGLPAGAARHTEVSQEAGEAAGDAAPVSVLRGTGTRRPLFLFHPAGGQCHVYRPLVERLSEQLPVYGFERLEGDLSGRVTQYLGYLRELQPEGPYRLGGWSFGGALAYQAACELAAAGEEVELVTMIDTMLPLPDPDGDPRMSSARRFLRFAHYISRTYGAEVRLGLDELLALPTEQQIELVMQRVADSGVAMTPGALRHQRDSFVDTRATERHEPTPFDGPVVLYRAGEPHPTGAELEPRYQRRDSTAGWEEFCARLEVVPVAGNHLSIIDPPHVDAVARHLDGALNRPGW